MTKTEHDNLVNETLFYRDRTKERVLELMGAIERCRTSRYRQKYIIFYTHSLEVNNKLLENLEKKLEKLWSICAFNI